MRSEVDGLVAIVRRELRRRLVEEQLPRISRCARLLGDERIWHRPSANANSVGNLILHLCGNTTQWILAQFTDLEDGRRRDEEFATRGGVSVEDLCTKLEHVYRASCDVVDAVPPVELLATRSVQGYTESGLSAILHVLEHSSGHAGQVYSWTKQVTGVDLRFYDH